MLLIGGGYLEVKVAEGGVLVWLDKGEAAGETTYDSDLAGIGLEFDTEQGVILPGDFGGFWCGFDLEARREAVGDVVGDLFAVVHVDGGDAFFLRYKGMLALRGEEECGEQQALGGCGSEIAFGGDYGGEICFGIVEADEVIDMRFDALGDDFGEPFIEAPLTSAVSCWRFASRQ